MQGFGSIEISGQGRTSPGVPGVPEAVVCPSLPLLGNRNPYVEYPLHSYLCYLVWRVEVDWVDGVVPYFISNDLTC